MQTMTTELNDPARPKLGPFSWYARRGKLDYFLPRLPKDGVILDVGCGDNWFKQKAAERGWHNVTGIDIASSAADIVGDIRAFRDLGLEPHSVDAIVAFEIIEHGVFADAFHDLLKPAGHLIATTPVPQMDPVCKALEKLHLLQRRTSPHTHLTDLNHFPGFRVVEHRVRALLSQWAILTPA